MDSVAAVEFLQPLEFCFIDADHSYEGCMRDIRSYWDAVRPAGIVSGHDYCKDDLPGVTKAVDEFSHDRGVEVNSVEGNIWWIRRR